MTSPGNGAFTFNYRRWRYLVYALVAVFIFVAYRLFMLQVVHSQELSEQAKAARTRTSTLLAQRGDILDSEGNPLATSVERVNLVVDQTLIHDYIHRDSETRKIVGTGAAEAARLMAPILGRDRLELGAELVGDKRWVMVAKNLLPSTYNEIAALRIRGVFPERAFERIYPNDDLAGTAVGFTAIPSAEGEQVPVGVAGLESYFDADLTGRDGQRSYEAGFSNKVIPTTDQVVNPAVPGKTVHTTINRDIQRVAEDAINKAVADHSATWGTMVVTEVGTGRILALADSGRLDPNDPGKVSAQNRESHAVSSPTEPGSTGKLPTFAAAFDQKTITPVSAFPTAYRMTMPNGEVISDNDVHAAETLTVAGILAKSYNTGLVQIGDTVKDEKRYEYMRKFGLGAPVGIEMPAESSGILRPWDKWGPRDRYTNMFGQGFSLTAVQLAGIVHAIANDGVYIAPHLTDGLSDPGSERVTPVALPREERIISSEAAANMVAIMEEGTRQGGTSVTARVDGYRVAGKTGTAQTADAAGPLHGRVGTFVGIIPADNPRIAVSVVIYLPQGLGYGSLTAAPAFKTVATFAMRELGVPPSATEHTPLPWNP